VKFSNNYDLPEPIVRAVIFDPYTKGDSDFSATGLAKPARAGALEIKHADEITEDVSDRLWSLLGQLGHLLLERAYQKDIWDILERLKRTAMETDSEEQFVREAVKLWPALRKAVRTSDLAEMRLHMTRTYEGVGEVRISGMFDFLRDAKALRDYKWTSVWAGLAAMKGEKPDWESQLNTYRLLGKENFLEIESLAVNALLRDWSKTQVGIKPGYPPTGFMTIPVKIWSDEQTEEWIEGRVRAHHAARSLIDTQGMLPECTPEERWAKPDRWSVMKLGGKKPSAWFDSKAGANMYKKGRDEKAKKGEVFAVQYEPGTGKRCEHYCQAAPFCHQYAALVHETQTKETA
jgi:hypothetical protein